MSTATLKDGSVVSDGRRLIDDYLASERHLMNAKLALNSALCDMTNTTNALGKWLCPENAKDGEKFCIWHCGHLLEATRVDMHTYSIVIRERARL